MSNTRNILRQIKSKDNVKQYENAITPERERLDKYLQREEEEKYKDEITKTHERYRRKQKNTETAMSLEHLIRPAKKKEKKPGTYFYGPLKKLAEDIILQQKYKKIMDLLLIQQRCRIVS